MEEKLTISTYEESDDVHQIGKHHDPDSSHCETSENADGIGEAYAKYMAPGAR